MIDYTNDIKRIFSVYRPWVENSGNRVTILNQRLNKLNNLGYSKIVDRFISSENPDSGANSLFEIFLFWSFLNDNRIKNIQYEPEIIKNKSTPDFRFTLEEKQIDIQAKRIESIEKENVKELIYREFKRNFENIKYSYLVELWISDYIKKEDINNVINHIRNNLSSANTHKTYYFRKNDYILVSYKFISYSMQGVHLGVIHTTQGEDGLAKRIDMPIRRKKIKKLLDKAKKSFHCDISENQYNIVIITQNSDIWFTKEELVDCLYGDECYYFVNNYPEGGRKDNGIFAWVKKGYHKIFGLIYIDSSSYNPLDDKIKGFFYPNTAYLNMISKTPKLYEPFTCVGLPEWLGKRKYLKP